MTMKGFSVLIPSLSPKKFDLIDCFRHNPDNVPVKVYVTNSNPEEFPLQGSVEGCFPAPRNTDPGYLDFIINVCLDNDIKIILPRLTTELELFSKNIQKFVDTGLIVAAHNYETIVEANDKIRLLERFKDLMPQQTVAKSSSDVLAFASRHKRFCCKLPKSAGAVGFAIVDDKECDNLRYFHTYGNKHHISVAHLCRIIDSQKLTFILQEYVDGYDYSVSLMANYGHMTRFVGYVGYETDYSCITYGEIKHNQKAFEICQRLCMELGLNGIAGVDFILTPNGDVKLLEVNPRITASIPFVTAAGCNMPYLLCKKLLGWRIDSEGNDIKEGLKMRKHYESDYFV